MLGSTVPLALRSFKRGLGCCLPDMQTPGPIYDYLRPDGDEHRDWQGKGSGDRWTIQVNEVRRDLHVRGWPYGPRRMGHAVLKGPPVSLARVAPEVVADELLVASTLW